MFEDQPPFGADEKCRAAFFGDHPLGPQRAGHGGRHRGPAARRRCATTSAAAMRRATSSWPRPAASISSALVADCQRACGGWEPADSPARSSNRPRPRNGFQRLARASATQQYLLQMSLGPAAADDDRYAAKVLAIILGDDSGQPALLGARRSGHRRSGRAGPRRIPRGGRLRHADQLRPEDADEVYERAMRVYRDGPCRGRHRGRTAAGEEQGPLATRALQRAARPADVQRRRRLGLSPRISLAAGKPISTYCRDHVGRNSRHAGSLSLLIERRFKYWAMTALTRSAKWWEARLSRPIYQWIFDISAARDVVSSPHRP